MQRAIVRLEEVAQWLRVLAVCAEGPSLAPSIPTRQLTTAWDSKGLMSSLALHRHLYS